MPTNIISKAELGHTAPTDDLTNDAIASLVNAALKDAKSKDMPSAFVKLTRPQVERALKMLGREYPNAKIDPNTDHLEIPLLSDADRVHQVGKDAKKALLVDSMSDRADR